MRESEVRRSIVEKYLSEYDGVFPISLDNEEFSIPDPPETYTRLNVQFNVETQDTSGEKGNRKFLSLGITTIQVFTLRNEATKENDDLCYDIKNLFVGERVQSIVFRKGDVRTVGNDGAFYQQNVIIEFQFEDIR